MRWKLSLEALMTLNNLIAGSTMQAVRLACAIGRSWYRESVGVGNERRPRSRARI